VLESLYGARLTNAKIQLPDGLEEVVPSRLPNLHSGEEVLIAARMREGVKGQIRLEGLVGGKSFEQSFDIDVKTTTSRGNAFVPRVWASLRVADLENRGRAEDRAHIVALSKAYAVLSRHTSLLVLESKSMFSAFGVDRSRPQVTWSGEEEAVVSQQQFLDAHDVGSAGALGVLGGTMGTGAGGGGMGAGKSRGPRPMARPSAEPPAATKAKRISRNKGDSAGALADKTLGDDIIEEKPASRSTVRSSPRRRRRPLGGRRGGYWARRVRTTVARIQPRAVWEVGASVDAAKASLDEQPDSRDRHRTYVRALSYAGQLEEAEKAAEAWLVRDQLDAEALTYLSDAIGRQGRRQEALRILSGIVDLDPDRQVLHQRLIKAYRRAGMSEAACSHQVALAEVGDAKAEAIGAGVRCLRVLGHSARAGKLLDSVATAQLRVQAEAAASRPEPAERIRGSFTVEATWDRDVDLDLSIVTPQGTRLSWMGGRKRVIAERAHSHAGELVGLTRATPGTYVLEVNRTAIGGGSQEPISGELVVKAHGARRRIPFTIEQDRLVVGSVRVWREWQTEQVPPFMR
jgi:hypothetical protein